jgi:hypothetical protein
MNPNEVVIEGTLKPDGTLELDQKPNLTPGRVTVVLRSASSPAPLKEHWWQFLQRPRRELDTAGHHFMNDEEIKAHIEWLRHEDHIDELLRQVDEQQRQD